jgi:hypothetical protein
LGTTAKYLRHATSAAVEKRLGHHDQFPATHNGRCRGHRPGATLKYLRRTTSDQFPATHNGRRRGHRPDATLKYLRHTTSGAAGYGQVTTANYLRGAAGIGLGTTIKYLRGAAGIGLGTTAKYLVSQNTGAGNYWAKVHVHKYYYRAPETLFHKK